MTEKIRKDYAYAVKRLRLCREKTTRQKFLLSFELTVVMLTLSIGLLEMIYVSLLGLLMAKGKKIYHRNDLRQALSALDLPTRRILWLVLAQQEKDDDGLVIFDPEKVYTISARDYAQLCQIDESVAYKQLKDGVREIRSHLMEIRESELLSKEEFEARNRPKDGVVLFTVANHSYYSDGEGFIEVQLDPIMQPFISKLRNNFTGQFLLSALRLPDSNANKLYLLIREWISSGMSIHKDIDVAELKEKLGISESSAYKRFNLFVSSFFQRAVVKIVDATEFTDIKIEIIERRLRKASKVRISYEYEGQKQDFGNSGFLLGQEKKAKQNTEQKDQGKAQAKPRGETDHQPGQATKSADMKQINGKWETRQSAEAAGYIWDDY